jgi:sulfur carrier protein
MMQVTINGESQSFNDSITVSSLLQELGFGDKRIAVEVNESIIPKGRHAETRLCEGDKIEIIHAIGGG